VSVAWDTHSPTTTVATPLLTVAPFPFPSMLLCHLSQAPHTSTCSIMTHTPFYSPSPTYPLSKPPSSAGCEKQPNGLHDGGLFFSSGPRPSTSYLQAGQHHHHHRDEPQATSAPTNLRSALSSWGSAWYADATAVSPGVAGRSAAAARSKLSSSGSVRDRTSRRACERPWGYGAHVVNHRCMWSVRGACWAAPSAAA
jgi:hypothetical protein